MEENMLGWNLRLVSEDRQPWMPYRQYCEKAHGAINTQFHGIFFDRNSHPDFKTSMCDSSLRFSPASANRIIQLGLFCFCPWALPHSLLMPQGTHKSNHNRQLWASFLERTSMIPSSDLSTFPSPPLDNLAPTLASGYALNQSVVPGFFVPMVVCFASLLAVEPQVRVLASAQSILRIQIS